MEWCIGAGIAQSRSPQAGTISVFTDKKKQGSFPWFNLAGTPGLPGKWICSLLKFKRIIGLLIGILLFYLFQVVMELMELTGKTAKTEKMELQGLLDLQEPKGKQVPQEQLDVMDYPVHLE